MKYNIKNIFNNRIVVLILLLILTIVIMSILSPYFLTYYNIMQILRFGCVLALVSIGENLVILAGKGGIDLSVGSIISLSGIILIVLYKYLGINIPLSIIIVLIFGIILGIVNAVQVVLFNIPPLIATLGTLYMYGGLALVIAKTGSISGFPEYFSFLGQGEIFGIPTQILLFLLPISFITILIMKNTSFGRNIYLIGINNDSARFAGINFNKIRILLYSYSGFLAALGGIIMASWFMTAKADVGKDIEMQAITVVMLGGTSIKGGVGSVVGTLISVLIITMISTGLQLAQINSIWQMAVLGTILLITVIFNKK